MHELEADDASDEADDEQHLRTETGSVPENMP